MINLFELALDPCLVMKAQGMEPDSWQRELMLSVEKQIILNCCRQSGKSTTTAGLAAVTALTQPKSLTLILSKAQRQASETMRKTLDALNALGRPVPFRSESALRVELENESRIICLPGKEDTVRGFSGVSLLVIDEASRVPDDLYRSVRPMLAVSGGRIVCLSTPFGKRGFFYREWSEGVGWHRIKISADQCPRITKEFLLSEKRSMGDSWLNQEYFNSFEAMTGLVYPGFRDAIIDDWPMPRGRPVGGIDFGFSDPFAAVWGVYDAFADTLYIGAERYKRYAPLHDHIAKLPKGVEWHADPSGRTETEELRAAGCSVRKACNDIKAGVAAVTARLQTGRLKVLRSCVDLISESELYCYPEKIEGRNIGENPVDDNNHAMDALRYLVAGIDRHFIAKFRKRQNPETVPTKEARKTHPNDPWLRMMNNPNVWKVLT